MWGLNEGYIDLIYFDREIEKRRRKRQEKKKIKNVRKEKKIKKSIFVFLI